MLTTKLELKDLFQLEFNECFYGNGIVLEATILDYDKSLGSLPTAAEKLYFRVDTGPYNYCATGNSAWISAHPDLTNPNNGFQREEIEKPDNYVCWRLPQHERRLWQAGFPVYFGFYTDNGPKEIQLDPETAEVLKKDFN
jgi:hypothetical protein